jgi:hypothetical protein
MAHPTADKNSYKVLLSPFGQLLRLSLRLPLIIKTLRNDTVLPRSFAVTIPRAICIHTQRSALAKRFQLWRYTVYAVWFGRFPVGLSIFSSQSAFARACRSFASESNFFRNRMVKVKGAFSKQNKDNKNTTNDWIKKGDCVCTRCV